jgi:hypothetical protein
MLPSLAPSAEPQHGLALAAIVAVLGTAAAAARRERRKRAVAEPTGVRVTWADESATTAREAQHDDALEARAEQPARRRVAER